MEFWVCAAAKADNSRAAKTRVSLGDGLILFLLRTFGRTLKSGGWCVSGGKSKLPGAIKSNAGGINISYFWNRAKQSGEELQFRSADSGRQPHHSPRFRTMQ